MALNLEKVGQVIALIKNKKDENLNKLLSLADKGVATHEMREFICGPDEVLEAVPDMKTERCINYVAGKSGSGKSYYCARYIEKYHDCFKKRNVILFSYLEDDTTLDKIKYIKRIKIRSPEFLRDDIPLETFKDSLIVFDDTDSIKNKQLKAKIADIQDKMLMLGRHFNISVLICSHNLYNGPDTKLVLNEAHGIVFFPNGIGQKQINYLLEVYIGLDKEQRKK